MEPLRPGERVPQSGIYRVYHHSHRLMHEATLIKDELFPHCRQCAGEVRFEFIHPLKDEKSVLPFRSGEILEEHEEKAKRHKQGR
jgi:hypothetical protein